MMETDHRETDMPGPPQDFRSVIILTVMIASVCVIYWRIALRIIAICIISFAIYGTVLIIEGLHHVAG